ncbi:uncharacterized protein BDZ99DRAFT_480354 [Mytilinidion resinicola]|uniref:Uncharacterized protein n=1 Tax=Mytilinidion resinicola TaxID=574789 RepID=A0A6A6YAN9_9PEZI|nr:uncharacterized protein BDZ99DRAFT_480354 [Mytilinidion resinicola]KAF2805679.1 hypothetical protein BDZ99DRAFT_480354 [Mytilinidion resinicola]
MAPNAPQIEVRFLGPSGNVLMQQLRPPPPRRSVNPLPSHDSRSAISSAAAPKAGSYIEKTTAATDTPPQKRTKRGDDTNLGKRATLSSEKSVEEREAEDSNQKTNISIDSRLNPIGTTYERVETAAGSAAPTDPSYHNASTGMTTQMPLPALPVGGNDSVIGAEALSAPGALTGTQVASSVIQKVPLVKHRKMTTANGDEDTDGSDTDADIAQPNLYIQSYKDSLSRLASQPHHSDS